MNIRSYSELDREIITLAAVWDLIDSMVNYRLFKKEHQIDNANLMFKTSTASELFLIILVDFLSLPHTQGEFGLVVAKAEGSMGKTYLGLLKQVADKPMFKGDTAQLALSVHAFAEWLDGFATIEKAWLPSIAREGSLKVRRMTYLDICGTASKHGFTRLGSIVNKIIKLLKENGTTIDEGQGYLVIPDFQEWFRENVFIASSTLIA